MNIKDFLIENYIWLLVIILITIITIIGFLADKKRGGKKEKKASPAPNNLNNQPAMQPQMNVQPIQYQQPMMQPNQMNNNMGLGFNSMNTTVTPLNQTNNLQVNTQPPMMTEPTPVQPTMANVAATNPQPIENVAPNVEQEPMYQPLSEQKPVIAPQPVPNIQAMQSPMNTDLNPLGANPPSQMQPMNNTLNVIPTMNPTEVNQPMPMPTEQPINVIPTYNVQPQPMNNNNFAQTPNFIPNNSTIPTPANPIPAPQPVAPEPIMQGNYNQAPNMGLGQNMAPIQPVGQSAPNQNEMQPQQNVNPQPISFVYGPQNNNPNM